MHVRALVVLMVLALPFAVGAEVFRCTNSEGKVEYTDAPCVGTPSRTVSVHQNVLPAQGMREQILKDAVHIGARIAALAGASEVLVSSTVKDLVAGSGLTFEDRGRKTLKGVPGEWATFAVAG